MKKNFLMCAAAGVIFFALGRTLYAKRHKKKTNSNSDLADKHLQMFLLANYWIGIKQEGKSVAEYLKKRGINEIAVYGMSYLGETLIEELSDTDIKIKYGIDKSADDIYAEIQVVKPIEDLEKVDAVIVTSVAYYKEILEELSLKIDCPIISLETIISEMRNY